MCVCVCKTLPLRVGYTHPCTVSAGGHSSSLELFPTELPVKLDIRLDQLDVPASIFKLW